VLLNPDRPGKSTQDPTDPGAKLVRVCQKNSQCNDLVKPSQAGRSTRDPSENRPGPDFFFQIWDLKLISVYTLCSQEKKLCFFNVGYKYTLCSHEKNYVFSMWDTKRFCLNTST